jgi:hypothetical protein
MSSKQQKVSEAVLDKIKESSFHSVNPALLGRTHLSIDPVAYSAGEQLHLVDRVLTVRQDAALAFIDEVPGANWGHPCVYQFHDLASGDMVQEERAYFPPDLADRARKLTDFHAPLGYREMRAPTLYTKYDWRKILGVPKLKPIAFQDRYAILFTSQISNQRHVEDCEFMWRTLVDVFGFAEDHIQVLCYDGTIGAVDQAAGGIGNYVGDNTPFRMNVTASATTANLQAAFDSVGAKLKWNDLLFIHTNNHGATSGLCVDNSTVVTPDEWGTMLSGLPKFGALVVMMEQCFSGAFSTPTTTKSTAAKTVFSSAAPADEVSWGDWHFDPYARLWIESVNGATAYGAGLPGEPDGNHNGRVSMKEAFDYAKAQDNTGDHPQYADSPAGCGSSVYLGGASLEDLLKGILERLKHYELRPWPPIPWPGPGPDPGPERFLDRTAAVARELAGLAKAVTSIVRGR